MFVCMSVLTSTPPQLLEIFMKLQGLIRASHCMLPQKFCLDRVVISVVLPMGVV